MTSSSITCHCQCSLDVKKSKSKKTKGQRVNNNDDNIAIVQDVCQSLSIWPSISRSPSREKELCFCRSHHHLSNCSSCSSSIAKHSSTSSQSQALAKSKTTIKYPQDSGYCSANSSNLTTPEGSDVACTEGLCNHYAGLLLSLVSVRFSCVDNFAFFYGVPRK